jgi:hypothetical protein
MLGVRGGRGVSAADGVEAGGESPAAQTERQARRVTASGLVTLQLLSWGYGPERIAALRGVGSDAVAADLVAATQTLGVSTPEGAVAEARRRRLID